MKEPVLERPSPVMEIKDSEPFLYSSHSENSDRVAKKKKKYWEEGRMAKLASILLDIW
jgi:hypothetical protein